MSLQIINVPVGVSARSQMVGESGAETPKAVGIADVDVETWLKLQAAKLADSNKPSFGR